MSRSSIQDQPIGRSYVYDHTMSVGRMYLTTIRFEALQVLKTNLANVSESQRKGNVMRLDKNQGSPRVPTGSPKGPPQGPPRVPQGSPTRVTTTKGPLPGGVFLPPVCSEAEQSCANRGLCRLPMGRCDCTMTSYTGDTCTLGEQCVQLCASCVFCAFCAEDPLAHAHVQNCAFGHAHHVGDAGGTKIARTQHVHGTCARESAMAWGGCSWSQAWNISNIGRAFNWPYHCQHCLQAGGQLHTSWLPPSKAMGLVKTQQCPCWKFPLFCFPEPYICQLVINTNRTLQNYCSMLPFTSPHHPFALLTTVPMLQTVSSYIIIFSKRFTL